MNREPVQLLLIEDNPGDAHLIRQMISDINLAPTAAPALEITWCKTLREGLALLNLQPIHLVLLDLTLPDSSGLVTLARTQASAPTLPIVVLTGVDDEELSLDAVHNGAQDYLVKGQVDAQLLKRSIRYALERMELMATLRKYSHDLEQQNAELDAYAHTVAHDLKNPLAAMVGNAQLLLDAGASYDRAMRNAIAADIVHAGHKLYSIIQELLLFSQVRRTDVESTPLDMPEILNEAMAQLTLIAPNFEKVTITNPSPDWPIARGYAPWIEEVWVNYLSNALKYGGRPPQICVGAGPTEYGMIRFWVSDNGSGLTPEQLDGIFVEFTRLSQARATGHGLGLSIVKRIIEKLGGQVGVESEPGYGSTFYFTLPAA
ncbi:MAG: hybrid sensor histidine kinase/response regulator [Anaerolineales bacterium]|nr:hybrid sensor histidine kinase/response regulator [Anaerolineales bacterium]